ncbi:MAG: hypothetical protein AAGG51_30695 [Cyanobacteria bacterium P01_G01_bin.54]
MRQIVRWIGQRWQPSRGSRWVGSLLLDGKLRGILLLGLLLGSFCIMGLVLGSALLLARVGTGGLPWVYGCLGMVSLPLYLGLAQVVDRIARPRLLQGSLVGAIAAIALMLMSMARWPDASWVYIASDVCLYSLWILLLEVLFPSFVTDYFTALDWQRCASRLRIAIALGGLLGGALVALLVRWWSPAQLLWLLMLIALGTIALVAQLAQTLEPLSAAEPTRDDPHPFTRQAIADYPIIPLLAASTFLTVVLYCLGEYLYLGIYATALPNATHLAQFLAQIRIVNNVIPLLVLYGLTQPLLHRFGVVWMNLAYPLTTLAAFLGLAISPNLAIALLSNLNNDGLEDSLNQPIAILNYNAVPYHWVGRVRALCHGLMYSVGLMLAGSSLALLQQSFTGSPLTQLQVAAVGVGASLLFLGLRYSMGRSYLRSLLQLLRAQRLDWEQASASFSQLPQQYSLQVDELLHSDDHQAQHLGITLASRLRQPQHCLPDLWALVAIAPAHSTLTRRLGRFFWEHTHPAVAQYLRDKLMTATVPQQQLALEALIRRNEAIARPQLAELLTSVDPTVRGLSYLAAERWAGEDWDAAQDSTVCEQLPLASRLTVLRVIRATGDRRLIPLVQCLIEDQTLAVMRAGLETLAVLAAPGEPSITALAQRELSTFDPLIRALNMQLLGRLQSPQFLLDVAVGLEHRKLSVRLWSAQALANYGNKSLRFAKTYLYASRPEVVSAAIAALGRLQSKAAIETLFNFLTPDYRRLKQIQIWHQALPQPPHADADEIRLHQLLADAQERIVERVWLVLKVLEGNSRLLQELEPFLHNGDVRLRASAVERLASGRWRRFVLPLLPLLNPQATPATQPLDAPPGRLDLIQQLGCSDDRWLRLGALLWLANHGHPIPAELCTDPNPLVQRLASALQSGQQEDLPENDWFLNQLFFLKQATPLGILSFEELEMINPLLNQQDYRQGETIFSPLNGSPPNGSFPDGPVQNKAFQNSAPQPGAPQLYLMVQGQVRLKPLNLTLTSGDVFGQLTLLGTAIWQPGAIAPDQQYSAIAQTDCCLLTLSELRLKELIDRCPRILWCLANLNEHWADYPSGATQTPILTV